MSGFDSTFHDLKHTFSNAAGTLTGVVGDKVVAFPVDDICARAYRRLRKVELGTSFGRLKKGERDGMKGFAERVEKLAQPVLRIGFVDRLLHDPPFANLVTLCAGAFGNLALAVFNLAQWLMNPSPWSGAMTVYFIALVIMSSLVAASTGSNGKLPWRIVAVVCGVTLVVLAAIVAVIIYLCISEGHNIALPEFAMIALAAFTFYNAVVAIITATKTRKGDLRQQTLLRVSLAGTIGALLILEMQMFGTYADLADPQVVVITESISGGIGALLVLLMGCSLLSKNASRGSESHQQDNLS